MGVPHVDLNNMVTYDFTFRAIDDEGAYCRYDAVLAYTAAPDDPMGVPGRCYLVYVDEQPDSHGDVATYASVLLDPAAAEKAQEAVDSGSAPKKPPLLELAVIETDEELDLIERILAAVDELGDED